MLRFLSLRQNFYFPSGFLWLVRFIIQKLRIIFFPTMFKFWMKWMRRERFVLMVNHVTHVWMYGYSEIY
ncbi:hypothetical protein ES319_A08G147600v1 [Gossypium barbadense]|uniref:Uncharacterized protein n=2 Tax=Gossypium TaxID=3633 RepID=A0A5J5USB5_GOSBA|nr:hypothetical protein ES319_A08G147600v1 [Gossypium barbadense]TYH06533.1 hypothetical protein ES288_A08G162100v1 [Gossypium darwinii]